MGAEPSLYLSTGRHQFILPCQTRWDKLGLPRCCNRKQLQAEFWSYKWSYIRQSFLPKNFWHYSLYSRATVTSLSGCTSRKQPTLPVLGDSWAALWVYPICVREKTFNESKMSIFSTRSEIVFQFILPFLFIHYTDRKSGRTSSSRAAWSKVSPKHLFRFLMCLRSCI